METSNVLAVEYSVHVKTKAESDLVISEGEVERGKERASE